MNSSPAASPKRPHRWLVLAALVLLGQLGLILWLGQRTLPQPQPPAPVPRLQLAGFDAPGTAELLKLTDPTLFALPHRDGFAGLAWLTPTPQTNEQFTWTEPVRWLEPAPESLCSTFDQFLRTNQFTPQRILRQGPSEALAGLGGIADLPVHSRCEIEGDLAGRSLLTSFELPSWPHADLLTNSVVQVLVSPEGYPLSITLLKPGSGSFEADQHALEQARKVRFQPLASSEQNPPASPLAGLAWGHLIFEWHTLPPPSTNTPSGT